MELIRFIKLMNDSDIDIVQIFTLKVIPQYNCQTVRYLPFLAIINLPY